MSCIFSGIISNQVTSLHIPFDSEARIDTIEIDVKKIKPLLATMKRVFPFLTEIVAVFEFTYPFTVSYFQKLK
jgi:hypothetical protein